MSVLIHKHTHTYTHSEGLQKVLITNFHKLFPIKRRRPFEPFFYFNLGIMVISPTDMKYV